MLAASLTSDNARENLSWRDSCPCAVVSWGQEVVSVKYVLDALRDIAMHIKLTKGVRLELPDRRDSFPAILAFLATVTARFVTIICVLLTRTLTLWACSRCSCSRRVLPFCFAGEMISLSRHCLDLGQIAMDLLPCDGFDGAIVTAVLVGTGVSSDDCCPLRLSHLRSTNQKWLDPDLCNGLLGG